MLTFAALCNPDLAHATKPIESFNARIVIQTIRVANGSAQIEEFTIPESNFAKAINYTSNISQSLSIAASYSFDGKFKVCICPLKYPYILQLCLCDVFARSKIVSRVINSPLKK
jgi:ABC-type transport system involved in cytochrome c biogenesis permease subunit